MKTAMNYETARDTLLNAVYPVGTEQVSLDKCPGRILARELTASKNVPPFDRSPYDGYALRAADTAEASEQNPVTLRILEEIAAGGVSHMPVVPGTAVKILTGAPIPPGADAVTKFELTRFTKETVTVLQPMSPGENIVLAGEDVRAGELLAETGCVIDPGLAGTLASQGVAMPEVFTMPKIGIISTGNEVVEVETPLAPGKIHNSNRYSLTAALLKIGCEPVYLGIAGDTAEAVSALMLKGAHSCDAVILTGGVSVGDYDMTPAALDMTGAETLVRNVALKPGGACVYGLLKGKLICGLSGNPASSLTNFYAVALPALRKLAGYAKTMPEEISATLSTAFKKKSPQTRMLRGRLELKGGTVSMALTREQGNTVLSSAIGCNAMAIVPAGSGPLPAGTVLKGFLI